MKQSHVLQDDSGLLYTWWSGKVTEEVAGEVRPGCQRASLAKIRGKSFRKDDLVQKSGGENQLGEYKTEKGGRWGHSFRG